MQVSMDWFHECWIVDVGLVIWYRTIEYKLQVYGRIICITRQYIPHKPKPMSYNTAKRRIIHKLYSAKPT